jgi:hypothetical protein
VRRDVSGPALAHHPHAASIAQGLALGARQAYLDGELSGVFPDGITSFSMIQAASDVGNAAGGKSARFLQPGDRLVGVRRLTRA